MRIMACCAIEVVGAIDLMGMGDILQFTFVTVALVAYLGRYGSQIV